MTQLLSDSYNTTVDGDSSMQTKVLFDNPDKNLQEHIIINYRDCLPSDVHGES